MIENESLRNELKKLIDQMDGLPVEVIDMIVTYVPRDALPLLIKLDDGSWFQHYAEVHFRQRFDLQITVDCSDASRLLVDFGLWRDGDLVDSIDPQRLCKFPFKFLTLKKIKLTGFVHSLNCCILEEGAIFWAIRRCRPSRDFQFTAEQSVPVIFYGLKPSVVKLCRPDKKYLEAQHSNGALKKLEMADKDDLDDRKKEILKIFAKPTFEELVLSRNDENFNVALVHKWMETLQTSKTVILEWTAPLPFSQLQLQVNESFPGSCVQFYESGCQCCAISRVSDPSVQLVFKHKMP